MSGGNRFRAAADPSTRKGAAPQRDPLESNHMKHTNIAPLGQPNFIHEGHIRLTPAQAGAVLREYGYDRNRDVTRAPDHVATLTETMRRGLWRPKDQLAFATLDGRLVLVNGHHRMAAQASSGVDIVWDMVIYPVTSEAELAALYHRFDTNVRVRSDQNIIAGTGFGDGSGLDGRTVASLYRAAPIIGSGLKVANRQKNNGGNDTFVRRIVDDRIAIATDYMPEAKLYQDAIKNAPVKIKSKLLGGAIMALALATFRTSPVAAEEFWTAVAENDGLRRGDPRAALVQNLMETQGNAGPMGGRLYLAAKAWNAFCAGKEVQVLRFGGRINVSGTAFWVSP